MSAVVVVALVVAYFSLVGAAGLYWIAREWTYDAPGARAYVLWIDRIIDRLKKAVQSSSGNKQYPPVSNKPKDTESDDDCHLNFNYHVGKGSQLVNREDSKQYSYDKPNDSKRGTGFKECDTATDCNTDGSNKQEGSSCDWRHNRPQDSKGNKNDNSNNQSILINFHSKPSNYAHYTTKISINCLNPLYSCQHLLVGDCICQKRYCINGQALEYLPLLGGESI